MIGSQSLVQFLFTDQSYPKEESGLIYLISTGSFSCWGPFLPCVSVMNGAGTSVNRDTSGLQFHLYLATRVSTIFGYCWALPVNSITVNQKNVGVELRDGVVMGNPSGF